MSVTSFDGNSSKEPAGKLKPVGHGAKACLQEEPRPATPPVVRKHRISSQAEPGTIRVHHGKANDPDVSSSLVHGVVTKSSIAARSLINPVVKTAFQLKLQELQDAVCGSRKMAAVGRSHDWLAGRPAPCGDDTAHGVRTVRGSGVRDVINPPKTAEELEREEQEGHEARLRSYNSYSVGERIDRKYTCSHYNKDGPFGTLSPHFNDGRHAGESLRWLGGNLKFDDTNSAWRRSGSREDMALQLGVASARGRSQTGPPELTFGVQSSADHLGAGDIIHSAEPGHFVRGRERRRGLVNAVRHRLKKINFYNFSSLLQAFRHYDQKGRGMIDKEDLQAVCQQFQLAVSDPVLEDLMDDCDVDKDGFINFLEFCNFLSWKDQLPVTVGEQRIITNELQTSAAPALHEPRPSAEAASQALVAPEDLEPVKPGSSLKTVRTLRRPGAAADHFLTSSSAIGALSNAAAAGRASGIPSVRSDLPAPRIRSISDTSSYGAAPTAGDLVHPSISGLHGVTEQHFLCPRSKEEIAEIFRNVGVNISEETFEEAWKLASMKSPAGEVCVQVFRDTLREIKAV